MKNFKAFTLMEILVSIALFSILVLFLYQSLDMTQKSNQFYSDKLSQKKHENFIKKIFFDDHFNRIKIDLLKTDREDNQLLQFQTKNYYHNPFYQNVIYMVSREKKLLRVESKTKMDMENLQDDFFDNVYIDVLAVDVEKFKIIKKEKEKYVFYLLYSNQEKILFSF